MLPIFNNLETDMTLGKRSYLSAMVLMAEVDGPICEQEKRVLIKIADKLGVTEEEFIKLL
jgi:uncharacterized tellurite resistance protein B-like protein